MEIRPGGVGLAIIAAVFRRGRVMFTILRHGPKVHNTLGNHESSASKVVRRRVLFPSLC
jgi:hypothetical protein